MERSATPGQWGQSEPQPAEWATGRQRLRPHEAVARPALWAFHSLTDLSDYLPDMLWDSLPIIDAPRVRLRRIAEDDVDSIYRIFSNPEVMRYWSTPPLPNREAAVDLVNEIQESFRIRASLKWGIARQSDNEIIGTATLFNVDQSNLRCELGYCLDRAEWGKGYMQEALHEVLDFAFNTLGLHRIEADVDPRNLGSIRTVEKLGFQQEGYLRERWQVGGEIQDALFFGLLSREWKQLQRKVDGDS